MNNPALVSKIVAVEDPLLEISRARSLEFYSDFFKSAGEDLLGALKLPDFLRDRSLKKALPEFLNGVSSNRDSYRAFAGILIANLGKLPDESAESRLFKTFGKIFAHGVSQWGQDFSDSFKTISETTKRRILTEGKLLNTNLINLSPQAATLEILNQIDHEDLENYLSNSKQRYLAANQVFITRDLPVLKEDFFNLIASKAEQLGIPLSAKQAEQRLAMYSFGLIDSNARLPGLKAMTDNWLSAEGLFIADSMLIGLDASSTGNQMMTNFTHEVLHAISGKTCRIKYDGLNQPELVTLRNGLGFSPEDRRSKFQWLNEAMTEELTAKLLGQDYDGRYYSEERKLLAAINSEKPAQEALMISAYFENFDPQTGFPAWRKMMRELHNNFQPGLLQKLDPLVAKGDYEQAHRLIDDLRK